MRVILAALLATAALMTATPPADARDGCGRGWYFDGRACRPASGPGYGGPAYGPPPPAYGGGYDAPIYQHDNFGNPEIWFRVVVDGYGRPTCRQRNYTVQDGFCKPYRGF